MKNILILFSVCFAFTSAAEFTATDSENLQYLYDTTSSIYYDVNSYIVNLESLGSTVQWDSETWDAWMNVHDKVLYDMVKNFTDSYFSTWEENLSPLFENVETSTSELSAIALNTYTIQELISGIEGYLTALNSLRFAGSDLKVHDEKVYEKLEEVKGSIGNLNNSFDTYSSNVGHYHEGALELLNTINHSINSNMGGGGGDSHGMTQGEFYETMVENNVFDLFNKFYNFNDNIVLDGLQWQNLNEIDPKSEGSYEIYANSRSISAEGFLEFFVNWLKDVSRGRENDSKSLMLIAKSLKPKDTSSDEEEVENQVQEIQSKRQELDEKFSELSSGLKEETSTALSSNFSLESFDYDITTVISSSDNMPSKIDLGSIDKSHIFDVDIAGFKNFEIDTEQLRPLIEISRNCSIVMLYFTLLGFAIFILRFTVPYIDKLKDIILSALQIKA